MGDAPRVALTLLFEFMAIFLVVTFAVHLLVLSVSTARLQRSMAGHPGRGMALALEFGAVTPFCTCSTVPVVAGMAAAGVHVAALTAFLVVVSLVLAMLVAAVVTLLGVRPALDAVLRSAAPAGPPIGIAARAHPAARRSGRDLRALAPLLSGIALVGALLYGRVDAGLIGRVSEAAGPWAVPVAVLVGVPVYASTAVLLPLGSALLATGANLGVVTAFLIGATGLSLPEGIMLQRLLGTRYLAVRAAAFVAAAVTVGYAVQAIAHTGG